MMNEAMSDVAPQESVWGREVSAEEIGYHQAVFLFLRRREELEDEE